MGTNSASHGGAVFSAARPGRQTSPANGFCGWRTPYPPAEGGEFFVFNPTTGENGLTLRYLTDAPDDLATPVLFASDRDGRDDGRPVRPIVDGADNDTLGFEVFRGASCTDGVLGSPDGRARLHRGHDRCGRLLRIDGLAGVPTGQLRHDSRHEPRVARTRRRAFAPSADNFYWPKALPLSGIDRRRSRT